MHIATSGYVGIGTSYPSALLDVAGNVVITVGSLKGSYGAGGISSNLAIGDDALLANTTGNSNVATGVGALHANTTGYSNVASGYRALYSNTTGYWNVALGNTALYYNTTGSRNVALGEASLYSNTNGWQNIAIGDGALAYNTVGSNNIAIGINALNAHTSYGDGNVAIGLGVLGGSNSTGGYNTSIGTYSGSYITSGQFNTFLGLYAGSTVTSGNNNVILGGYTGNVAPISQTGSYYVVLSDGAGNIKTYYDGSGNQVSYGVQAISASATTIASSSTIAPTKSITFISGTNAIDTITVPSPISLGGGYITLIPTAAFTTTTAGNIALASTAVANKALTMFYDAGTAKWYPSY